jgi:hypothetical protein
MIPANATSVAKAEPDKRAPSRSPDQADASANDIQYAAQYHAATDEKTQEKIERGTMGIDNIRKATPSKLIDGRLLENQQLTDPNRLNSSLACSFSQVMQSRLCRC